MRYDNARGFIIFKDGAPYQAMRRLYSVRKIVLGYDSGEYWLLPSDGPMPAEMALFVYTAFARECAMEMVQFIAVQLITAIITRIDIV